MHQQYSYCVYQKESLQACQNIKGASYMNIQTSPDLLHDNFISPDLLHDNFIYTICVIIKDKRMIILYVVPISLWPMLGKENQYFLF